MMKKLMTGVLAILGASSLAGAAQAATPSFTTANVNLRAGPGTSYPVLVTVPNRGAITTHGCLENYNWCDVSWGAERGWMSASYIQVTYEGQPVYVTPAIAPVVGLSVVIYDRAYWDRWYYGRPWYANWDRYYRPPPPRPPKAGPKPRPPKAGPGPRPRPPQMVQPIQPPKGPPKAGPRPRPPQMTQPIQPRPPKANNPRPRPPQMTQPIQPRPPKANNPRPRQPQMKQPIQPRQPKAGNPRGNRQNAGNPRGNRPSAGNPRNNRQSAGNTRNRGGNQMSQNRSRRSR